MQPELSWVQWTAGDLNAAADAALEHKRSGLDALIAVPAAERTFRNTIAAFAFADDDLTDLCQKIDVLVSVHPDQVIRDAAQRAADRITEENVRMVYDRRLWHAVSEWVVHDEPLDPFDRKLADDTLRDMRRMGFDLGDDEFRRLIGNVAKLETMEREFEKTINEWEDHITVTRDKLAGLPDRYINGLVRDGNGYRVSLAYPEFLPFMRQADDDGARRELAEKNLRKGGPGNLELLANMVALRKEDAVLLGYPSHADFMSEPRMAGSARRIGAFLRGILRKLKPGARHELGELAAIKQRTLRHPKPERVGFHETAYWGYRLLQERYALDAEVLKEYFPLAHVMQGMLGIYQDVLGLRFTRCPDAVLWHPDMQLYEASVDGTVLGHFALDLYPRAGKYGHAASFPVVLGRQRADGIRVPGFVALVCNFPKPTPDDPSLLSHHEVETLFHEFGHVVHTLCSGGHWQKQNGFGVALDFVETPSQLFEEWAWQPDVLSRISAHFRTGEPLPKDLRDRLIASRHHMDANYYLQQAVKALFDLTVHSSPDVMDPEDLAGLYRTMELEHESLEIPGTSLFPAGWGHMADYDAGYYSYLWSKVYALDLFSAFSADPLDSVVGSVFRRTVLEPGASRREIDLVVGFLRREPSDGPFLKALGII